MSDGTFDFNQFLVESKETLINPKRYFSKMDITGGVAEPLIKVVIYGTLTGLLYLIWGILKIGAVSGGIYINHYGFISFITSIIVSVIGVFVGAIVLLIISSMCKGNTDFETNFRVTASLMVIMPIYTFFNFTSGINFYLAQGLSLIVDIFFLWLLYHSLVEALKCKAESAKIACYILFAITVLFLLLGLRYAIR